MEGAGSLDEGTLPAELPQAGCAPTSAFSVLENYVALPPSEAFRIEYWALEEAKIRRQPAAKELSGRVVLVVGCWWVGTTFDDLRREMHRRKRLQLLTGRDAPG